jgi:polar amino acid transport system ATP-binding protein
MLEIKNISKRFHNNTVIDDVSLTVKEGEIAVLLGASGVGKSTLLRVLNNLETLDNGSIILDDKPLDVTRVNQSHQIGMIFQQFNLFDHLTVLENITLPLIQAAKLSPAHAKERAIALLKRYELDDKQNAYISSLSGGQKQRLAIARTIALKPRVICMDEPTSALDPLLTTHVANSMMQLAKEGYIILAASHDTELLKKLNCSVYLMNQGRIVEYAPSADLYQHPENYPAITQFIRGEITS